ncbi:c2h2 finger domain-containing [Pyrenophora seminiperda CCB06]|uniref:C2h2 finger domain-containing n=1 Tax=Pyrenophora seminiperda CCB06 TaxID=1302712 RepID=A0A3M7LX34_9PLEO|nr:c2h2 finger domain-containing [Pyrenophora seminiperda CCB06]
MMQAVDTQTQPYEDPRRQQRHLQDVQANGYHTAPAAGNFLMPDAQGVFTFSAEPASIAYDASMVSLPSSNTPGQESIFTPNVGSSFDSSLHPDISYPQPNSYNQSQPYGLSPGSYYGNGQNISPSHSVEHFSPEAGYMSDPNYQDPTAYATTTSNFNGHLLDEFNGLSFTENGSTGNFPSYPGNIDLSVLSPGTLNTYNAQPSMLPINNSLDPHSQLLTPSATNNSSPALGEQSLAFPSMHFAGNMSTPPSHTPQMQHGTPARQMRSPTLTNSPGNQPLDNPRPLTRHMTSPIVRVENYSREESPSHSDNSGPVSKQSYGSRHSGNHLSPYAQNDDSDEEDELQAQAHGQLRIRGPERSEDGSWLATGSSGQSGLNPDERRRIGDVWIPSIEEIVEQRSKDEKKLEVQEWLTKSEVGSEAGDTGASNNLLKPIAGRRRAKSHNDVQRQAPIGSFGLGVHTDFDRIDDSGIPGPGVYIDERSDYGDYDYDDEDSAEPESPPAAIDVNASHVESSYFPPTQETMSKIGGIVKPWVDVPAQLPQAVNPSARYQPPTSNAAMMRFRLRAKDVEQASLAATVGSRRLSESDLGSLRASPGVAKLIEPDPKKSKERQRRPSFLENILPKRAPSGLLKRKSSIPVQQPDPVADKSREPSIDKPKRIGSWGRPKSPRVDTNSSSHSKDGYSIGSTGFSTSTGPWYKGPRNVIKRSRSRSDIGKSPGLAELMTQHGGPPMPMLASPLADTEATKPPAQPSPAGDDDDDDQDPVTMDLAVRTDPIIPTYDGFRVHARQLNPRLADFMVERVTQEQMRRYKRLLEFKVKHLSAVQSKTCASGGFCTELGGEAKSLPPRAGAKDGDASFTGFQVSGPGSPEEDGEPLLEGNVAPAAFPTGVPLPPVKRLPAEFECPLCFKVKKFYKPSDWTKHVHEDVQPFTCTFPNCGEPKSFKRKADWVRHENERHRQLENWTCQIADCSHTCYRKDNFVQHLVREHKIAEPRQRTGRGGNKDASATGDQDDIWTIVEQCRRDTTKQPKDEPCRFCGNICNSWKKLTVHLAKHMEQISMPILPLVKQKHLNADSIISPVVELPESRKLSVTPTRSSVDNPSRYDPKASYAPGLNPQSLFSEDLKQQGVSTTIQTYPPPQMVQPSPQANGYASYAANNTSSYSNQTYPGLQVAPKPHVAYANGLMVHGQPYQNGNMQNGLEQYGMTPISTVQQQQSIYTDSPVDTTTAPFPSYFAPDSQALTAEMPNVGYDTRNGMPYQGSTYPVIQGYQQPFITINDQYLYQNHVPQLHIDTSQQMQHWRSLPQARSLHDERDQARNRFGPVPAPRAVMSSGLLSGMNYLQAYPPPIGSSSDNGVDNHASLLSPCRYDHTSEESWNPWNRRGSDTNSAQFPLHQSNMCYRTHRRPDSDVDSQVLPSDEGYSSHMTTQSVLSNEPGYSGSELAVPLMEQLSGMNVGPTPPAELRIPSDQGSCISVRSNRPKKILKCPYCSETLKCKSDYNKHELKHTKPYKCDVPDCKRTDGFATTNDLDRHKSTVHRQNLNRKSYRCAAEGCKNKEKAWPRLDNFKQHVERMHPKENTLDLISRSTCYPREAMPSMSEEPTVAPMDTSFAVTGMEKSFSASPSIDTMPMLDLIEQEHRPWPSFDQSQDVTNSAYTTSRDFSRPTLTPNNGGAARRSGSPHSQYCAPGLGIQPPQVHLSTPMAARMEDDQDTLEPETFKAESPLSNAPQTKAEQQRSALCKFPEAISSPSNPVDLESFILNILHKATDSAKGDDKCPGQEQPGLGLQADGNTAILSKSDALKATQFISRLIKNSPGSANTVQRRSNQGFMSNPKVCEECDFRAPRDCDLRKHMKRHKKPFGCTYPKCHKRFGAKSDWKRHENSQHFQLEAFRCAQMLPSGAACCVHVHREAAFRDHLDQQHKMSSDGLEALVKKSRIGKNCQGSFWCGFCQTVVELKAKRNAAWDERFDHIANHFEKQQLSVDEWLCAEENKSKKELSEEMDRYFYDEDEREKSSEMDVSGHVDNAASNMPAPQPLPEVVPESSIPTFAGPSPSPSLPAEAMRTNSRKRSAPEDGETCSRPVKRTPRAPKLSFCCKCRHPCGRMDVQCLNCDHAVCRDCSVEQTSMYNMDMYQ